MAAFTSALLLALGGIGGVGATAIGAKGLMGNKGKVGGQQRPGTVSSAMQAATQPPSLPAPAPGAPAAPPSALQTQSSGISQATAAAAAARKRLASGQIATISPTKPALGRPRLTSGPAPTFSMLGSGY